MQILSGEKLLFIGDSVTDCDCDKTNGEGLFGALGNGYVAYVQARLFAAYPERLIRVVNKGVSGNNIRDLKNRWQADVLAQKPDWLSIMIGINDVWRQFDCPAIREWHVPLDEYARTMDELLAETKPAVKNIVLMTPYFIELNAQDAMRAKMDEYGSAVKAASEKHGTRFVDTQAAFDRVLGYNPSAAIAWDRVHPGMNGHAVIGEAFLRAVE
ncbi:MAG: SGNH/GDSL hydrolase family protein [Defluviitaleaceae bacterium]|nr:SGNH/GDSL hydrolase family protein [Defluviitaleaceae bacterium]